MKKKWILHNPEIGAIPAKPGVYCLISDGEVIYIGQSVNLQHRIRQHRIHNGFSPQHRIPKAENISCKYKLSAVFGDFAMWEMRLIRRLKPKFNCTHAGRTSLRNG